MMDPSRAIYDKDGNLLCPKCTAEDQIAEGDQRAVKSALGAAAGVLIGGILSMTCFNPFLLVSIITILSGVGWITMMARNAEHRTRMGNKYVPALVAVCIGVVLGALPLLMLLVGVTGLVLSR